MSCVAENIGRKINTFLKLVLVLSLLVVLCPLKAEAANILGTGVDGELVVNPGQTVFIDQWYNNKYGSNNIWLQQKIYRTLAKLLLCLMALLLSLRGTVQRRAFIL